MAINKKLIHFKNFSDFNSKKLSANENNTQYTLGINGAVTNGSPDILYQSICYIKDTKQQWTHGQLYDGSKSDTPLNETDPVFSASPAASITNANIAQWNNDSEMIVSLDEDVAKLYDRTEGVVKNVAINGSNIAKSGETIYLPNAGTDGSYGVVSLENSVSSTSTAKAATAYAVKQAYDLADSKQDIISDLATIRDGASKGITALQTYIVDFDISELESGEDILDIRTDLLIEAINTHKLILIPFDKEDPLMGYLPVTAYYEDMVYFSIANGVLHIDVNIRLSDNKIYASDIRFFNLYNIEQQIAGKMDKVTLAKVATSGNYNDLTNKPTIPAVVTESTVSGWGFTKNTGTYSKPSGGIPKSDLASAVQTALGKADTALQSHQDISGKADKSSLAAVATSGSYNDLSNKPFESFTYTGNIVSVAFGNDACAIPTIDSSGYIKNINGIEYDYDKVSFSTSGITFIPEEEMPDRPRWSIHRNGDGTKFLSDDGTYKTINGGGSSSGEDIRYFTKFTLEDFIEASKTNSLIGSGASELKSAAENNKLICIPYENADKGYIVASYSYNDYGDYSTISLRLEYNGNVYTLYDGDDELIAAYPINLTGGIVESLTDVTHIIEVQDNTIYVLSPEGEFGALAILIADPLYKGSTIRFFSSHYVDENGDNRPMMLELYYSLEAISWANGVMPEIEMDTYYELSLAAAADGMLLAVLTPFKPVE